MMDFSKSHCPTTSTTSFFDSDSEEDDDFLSVSRHGFGLRPGPSTGSSLSPSFATWNSSFEYHGRYNRTSLIPKINKIIEENQKSTLHAVEVASSSVTQLESRTRQLENSMDDLKVCVEYNHGRTGRKLKDLESILKEVHTDVKFLLDKQEIAETELQLLKLQRCRTATEHHETGNNDVQTTSSPHQNPSLPCSKSYQPVMDSRTVSLLSSSCANLPHLHHPPPQPPVLLQNVSPYLNQASNLCSPPPHESYYSPPCFTSPWSQYTPNRQQFEPYAESGSEQEQLTLHPSSQNSYDDLALESWQYSAQALPRAYFLDTPHESGSGGIMRKTSNEDIVEEAIAMGFRRDRVIATINKLKQKQESVDLITLLDNLMN